MVLCLTCPAYQTLIRWRTDLTPAHEEMDATNFLHPGRADGAAVRRDRGGVGSGDRGDDDRRSARPHRAYGQPQGQALNSLQTDEILQ